MIQPIKYKERVAINSLTGIKSSLPQIRSVVALAYLLYLACGRKATVEYSIQNSSQGLSLEDSYKSYIKTLLKDPSLDDAIDSNPLLKSQIESLYVGLTLMFGLGRISFVKPSFGMTIERTGGVRYPKKIDFASNMVLLDLIIQSLEEADRNSFLTAWLKSQPVSNEMELRVSVFLNICIENNLFKLRNGGKDTFFQTEGIYLALRKDDEVSLESDEKVGPARILNGMLKEGLIPWLSTKNSVVNANRDVNFDIDAFCKITSTSLDIRDIKIDVKEELLNDENNDEEETETNPLQQIYYGAPGTGKSHEIKEKTKGKDVIRTTFHPDSDYSTFVGAYKPVMEETEQQVVPVVVSSGISLERNNGTYTEKRISYKYIMQAFLKAYLGAWKKYAVNPESPEPQYLVIEEINRGNCAQIFGDLFQLLDRSDNGFSTYPIDADTDLRQAVKDAFEKDKDYQLTADIDVEGVVEDYTSNYDATLSEDIQNGRVLLLPSNLYIWATMNTSDQSLFPIDSAFKRRWDWKYIKIAEGRDAETKEQLNWVVKFQYEEDEKTFDFECSWWEFIQTINGKIADATSSDDKKLGYFFCKPKTKGGKEIDGETFVGKVVFYLWNDVFKDEENPIFKVIDGKNNPSFDDFYKEDKKGKTVVDTKALRVFMHNVFGDGNGLYTETEQTAGTSQTEE